VDTYGEGHRIVSILGFSIDHDRAFRPLSNTRVTNAARAFFEEVQAMVCLARRNCKMVVDPSLTTPDPVDTLGQTLMAIPGLTG
jgi:hypothetical protein